MSLQPLAKEHGGSQTATFNQAVGLQRNWRKLIPQSQGGVCGGLAIMWLAGIKHNMISSIFARNKYSEALFKYAEHAQELGADNSMGGAKGIETVANIFALQRSGAVVSVNNANAAKWILNGASRLVFIALSGHAVAVHVQKPNVTFFEPNYGQFHFPTTLKFHLFFPDYLVFSNYTANKVHFFK
jgi:Yersinia/Haemophilus virulence surface antigen